MILDHLLGELAHFLVLRLLSCQLAELDFRLIGVNQPLDKEIFNSLLPLLSAGSPLPAAHLVATACPLLADLLAILAALTRLSALLRLLGSLLSLAALLVSLACLLTLAGLIALAGLLALAVPQGIAALRNILVALLRGLVSLSGLLFLSLCAQWHQRKDARCHNETKVCLSHNTVLLRGNGLTVRLRPVASKGYALIFSGCDFFHWLRRALTVSTPIYSRIQTQPAECNTKVWFLYRSQGG